MAPRETLVAEGNASSQHPLNGAAVSLPLTNEEGQAAIERLCEFLRFPTVSSIAAENGAYVECAAWLKQLLHDRCGSFIDDIFYLPEAPDHSPVVVALWKGRQDELPVLLLNSHYDVVPADPADWTVPPFGGLRRDGKIYGRGAQDMKCVCLQYIEAMVTIHQQNPAWKPERHIYLTFVPDEGAQGNN